MPEYLAPGVYVEEVSFRSKSIEGVSTTTTGFIGPARYGPIDLEPDIITSVGEFERTYGDRRQIVYGNDTLHNYLWHAVRAFFQEGGKRLYIVRVFRELEAAQGNLARDGRASETIGSGDDAVTIRARFPGAAGNRQVRITLRLGQNVLGQDAEGRPRARGLLERDVVLVGDFITPLSPIQSDAYLAETVFDASTGEQTWQFVDSAGTVQHRLADLSGDPAASDSIQVVSMMVTVFPTEDGGSTLVYDGLALDPRHTRAGSRDSVFARFEAEPPNIGNARSLPIVIAQGPNVRNGLDLLNVLFAARADLMTNLLDPESTDAERSIDVLLDGGNDGQRPTADEYKGTADPNSTKKTGLMALEDISDISIVAAPGSTYGFENGWRANASTIVNHLIAHAQHMRYRIAVLDSGDGQSIAAVRAMRARIDSSYAALYYPWVRILDPVTQDEIHLPPSGFVAGIYARNDVNRAVYKAPANEVVNLAIGFEQLLNKAQQDVLNPEGVNCFRFFEGRGFRLWGARTVSSDPEWKYVNLRRYFAYLEHSIDRGTQWAVFEPNGEALWANVRRTVEDFLLNEWQNGALLGDKPEKAYFVRCDRSTMTQNDLDNGRLICLIGVAPLRPAEYVIFRIGQWTADRRG
jgi:uncharacterized protein